MASNLPPGVTHQMIEEHFGDQPCDVCHRMPDDCLCPECPRCGEVGQPRCYVDGEFAVERESTPTVGWHEPTLEMSRVQRVSRAEFAVFEMRGRLQEAEMYLEFLKADLEGEER